MKIISAYLSTLNRDNDWKRRGRREQGDSLPLSYFLWDFRFSLGEGAWLKEKKIGKRKEKRKETAFGLLWWINSCITSLGVGYLWFTCRVQAIGGCSMAWMSTQRKALCLLLITLVFSTCKYFPYLAAFVANK